ncbi:MAG: fumarylacetoacetase [Vicinamibacterales bacterium]
MYSLNETHNPDRYSWVATANDPATDFPLQNLPFGIFRPKGSDEAGRVGVAIGTQIVDVGACHREGVFLGEAAVAADACSGDTLNPLLALAPAQWSALRRRLSEILAAGQRESAQYQSVVAPCLVPQAEVEMLMPIHVGDYTDFYASVHHATNVGRMLRPDGPLLPNYKYVPIGYHGRASSVVVSGTDIRRPAGQVKSEAHAEPAFMPTRRLDYELEIGLVIGQGNRLGAPIPIADASAYLFGICLLNDWSARDVQQWEYQPLGPFLAKSFATTISPWIVTLEALEPFRTGLAPRAEGDPAVLPYLHDAADARRGGLGVQLDVSVRSGRMSSEGLPPMPVSRSQLTDLYWTPAQLIAHHTSNGCNLRPGDLLGTGTVSGPDPASRGCLLERTWRGSEPLSLPTGEVRRFLEDGDEVVFRGTCSRDGFVGIGLGECRGTIRPHA